MSRLPSPATISPPALTARQYRWLALVFLGLAIYGSLVPLRYRPTPFGQAVADFWTIALSPLAIGSRADWATNVLLFIPLSFLLMAALCVDRPRVAGLRAALGVVPLCALVSAAIEFTQVFFPPRTPSLNDVAAESIGGLLGTMAWLAWGHQITTWARALWTVRGPRRLAAWLLPGYLFALVLAHLMPFDLTIRPLEIYRKYHEGRVQWIPFATHATDPLALIQKDLENLVGFFPVGLLLTQLPGLGRRSRWSGRRVFGLGLATAGLIELLQLFVSSRFFETTDVVTGGLAVWAGWRVGTVCWRSEADLGTSANARGVSSLRAWYPLGFLGWLAVLVLIGWQPFDFTADTVVAARRLQRLSLVPFADYYRGTEYHAFDQFVCKILLFFPLGAFVASAHPWGDRGRAGFLVMVTALGLAAGLEAGQLFLAARHPSVTDVLIEVIGAWLGCDLTGRFRCALQVAATRDQEMP